MAAFRRYGLLEYGIGTVTKKFFLINASGKDRPGIVAGLTQVLYGLGGNIEDSTMTRLGGEFAMMLIVSVPAAVSGPKLQKEFRSLEKKLSLRVESQPVSAALAHGPRAEPQYLISVYGADRPGIIFQVAQALAKRRVSITDLQTQSITRGGSSLYVLLLEIRIPAGLDMDDLRSELDRLRQSLQVELTLQDIEALAL